MNSVYLAFLETPLRQRTVQVRANTEVDPMSEMIDTQKVL